MGEDKAVIEVVEDGRVCPHSDNGACLRCYTDVANEIVRLRAEVERLREALCECAPAAHAGLCLGNFDECRAERCVKARAALEGGGK